MQGWRALGCELPQESWGPPGASFVPLCPPAGSGRGAPSTGRDRQGHAMRACRSGDLHSSHPLPPPAWPGGPPRRLRGGAPGCQPEPPQGQVSWACLVCRASRSGFLGVGAGRAARARRRPSPARDPGQDPAGASCTPSQGRAPSRWLGLIRVGPGPCRCKHSPPYGRGHRGSAVAVTWPQPRAQQHCTHACSPGKSWGVFPEPCPAMGAALTLHPAGETLCSLIPPFLPCAVDSWFVGTRVSGGPCQGTSSALGTGGHCRGAVGT